MLVIKDAAGVNQPLFTTTKDGQVVLNTAVLASALPDGAASEQTLQAIVQTLLQLPLPSGASTEATLATAAKSLTSIAQGISALPTQDQLVTGAHQRQNVTFALPFTNSYATTHFLIGPVSAAAPHVAVSATAGTTTVFAATGHAFQIGHQVAITNMSPSGYNVTGTVIASTAGVSFTLSLNSTGFGAGTGGTATQALAIAGMDQSGGPVGLVASAGYSIYIDSIDVLSNCSTSAVLWFSAQEDTALPVNQIAVASGVYANASAGKVVAWGYTNGNNPYSRVFQNPLRISDGTGLKFTVAPNATFGTPPLYPAAPGLTNLGAVMVNIGYYVLPTISS